MNRIASTIIVLLMCCPCFAESSGDLDDAAASLMFFQDICVFRGKTTADIEKIANEEKWMIMPSNIIDTSGIVGGKQWLLKVGNTSFTLGITSDALCFVSDHYANKEYFYNFLDAIPGEKIFENSYDNGKVKNGCYLIKDKNNRGVLLYSYCFDESIDVKSASIYFYNENNIEKNRMPYWFSLMNMDAWVKIADAFDFRSKNLQIINKIINE